MSKQKKFYCRTIHITVLIKAFALLQIEYYIEKQGHKPFYAPISYKPHYPPTGIGRDNRGFDPVLLSNSPLLGQLFISNSTKVPAIPMNHVVNLLRCIISTVMMNTYTIHRIYHIMCFNTESMNCMGLQLFNLQKSTV